MKKGRLLCRTAIRPGNSSYSREWLPKKWDALPYAYGSHEFSAYYVWSDGNHLYYSANSVTASGVTYKNQFVLNGDKWERKNWSGVPDVFLARYIWTDGVDVYCSNYSTQLVLKDGVWTEKIWEGVVPKGGSGIWSDGENIYHSWDDEHCVLVNGKWEPKTWNYSVRPRASYIWSDGENVYSTYNSVTIVLIGDTWVEKNWEGFNPPYGDDIWSDGAKVYYSKTTSASKNDQYVLDGGVWKPITWRGLSEEYELSGYNVWSDSRGIYYGSEFILAEDHTDYTAMTQGWIVGKRLAAMRGKA